MVEEKEEKEVKLMTDVITLIVQQQNVPDFYCTMKHDALLQKLMISYCKTLGITDYDTLQFTCDGKRVRDKQTVRDLCLKNGSVIDAWVRVQGGAAAAAASFPIY
ncbi:hypothetical protein POM88_027279 [Heracleum sosnowskyi]|uniref:Ubiquitin-like domain-containing protein n=1 Tax=Heracleum sosnowskyi TaxID=360622 RepID=A0AAD8MLC0_9APIA|nr:hypothetical protein POM88_027279 [Heracleum sosnowskyi]